jgi:GT2 family glycosyltransferase
MALIAMAIWDTNENERTTLTKECVNNLMETVDYSKHRIYLIDNGSCDYTKSYLESVCAKSRNQIVVITLPENIGTAKAINKAWQLRNSGENVVKMDNDVVIHSDNWVETLEECVEREPKIGIVGLKRKDCIETPWNPMEWYRSTLRMLPHVQGQRWLIVEDVHHVMGTCQLYNSALIDKIGYLYQMGELYGFDDALASVRAQLAGFITVHYPHILIDHIDPGGDAYAEWKKRSSGLAMGRFNALVNAYKLGYKSIYYGPEGE